MQCPNCRKIEKGQWLYANGCRSFPEFSMDDWTHDEDLYDLSYSEMVKTIFLLEIPFFIVIYFIFYSIGWTFSFYPHNELHPFTHTLKILIQRWWHTPFLSGLLSNSHKVLHCLLILVSYKNKQADCSSIILYFKLLFKVLLYTSR